MTPYGLPPSIVLAALFVVGALIARWINVCVERIPFREWLGDQWRVSTDRITREDVVAAGLPIVGPWTARGARVFGSRGRGVRAGIVELGNGLLLATLYWFAVPLEASAGFGASAMAVPPPFDAHLTGTGWSPVALLHLRFLCHALLVQSLLAATLVDFDWKIIPGLTTDPFTLLAVVASFAIGGIQLLPAWYQEPSYVSSFLGRDSMLVGTERVPAWIAAHPHWHGLVASVMGLVVGGGVVLVLRIVGSWTLGREAMGQGDIYLMMTVGAFLGWQAALVVFFLAPIAALAIHAVSLFAAHDGEIPYGPYLSLAAVVVLLGWSRIFPSVATLFALGPLLIVIGLFMTVMLVALLLLMRLIKHLLGVPLDWDEYPESVWTAGDQHQYQSAERVDDQQGAWRGRRWPGVAAGRGRAAHDRWRHKE